MRDDAVVTTPYALKLGVRAHPHLLFWYETLGAKAPHAVSFDDRQFHGGESDDPCLENSI